MGKFLFYAFLVDFGLEMLDLVHRNYEADESLKTLNFMVETRLYGSQVILQIILGTLAPLGLLGLTQLVALTERARKAIYGIAAALTLVGIFAMRWNVVIGGQLFSKSFLGYTTYKMGFATREGLLPALVVLVLPLLILWLLVRLFPPMPEQTEPVPAPTQRPAELAGALASPPTRPGNGPDDAQSPPPGRPSPPPAP
jgi:Ni/Fe-hydrogenase subunit HybB-like protein